MITRFQKPTSQNITYTAESQALSPAELSDNTNYNGYLVNKAGTLEWEQANGTERIVKTNSLGLIPNNLLPSYVDDVLTYANYASFPVSGESGKIYVDESNGYSYRWTGSNYYNISTQSFYTKSELDNTFNTKVNLSSGTPQTITSDLTLSNGYKISTPDVKIDNLRDRNGALFIDMYGTGCPKFYQSLDLEGRSLLKTDLVQANYLNATTGSSITLYASLTAIGSTQFLNMDTVKTINLKNTADTSMFDFTSGVKLMSNMDANSKTITGVATLGATNINGFTLGGQLNFPNQAIYSSTGGTVHTQTMKATNFLNESSQTAFTLGTNMTMTKDLDLNTQSILNCNVCNSGQLKGGELYIDRMYSNGALKTIAFDVSTDESVIKIKKNLDLETSKNITNANNIYCAGSYCGQSFHDQILNNNYGSKTVAFDFLTAGTINTVKPMNMNNNNISGVATLSATNINGFNLTGGQLLFPNNAIYSSTGGCVHTQLIKCTTFRSEADALHFTLDGNVNMSTNLLMNGYTIDSIGNLSCDGLFKRGGSANLEFTTTTTKAHKDVDASGYKVRCLYLTANDDNATLAYMHTGGLQLEKNLLCNNKNLTSVAQINGATYKGTQRKVNEVSSTSGVNNVDITVDAGFVIASFYCTVDLVAQDINTNFIITDSNCTFSKDVGGAGKAIKLVVIQIQS